MKFSEKLKKLRADNNITQDELAEKIFVTRTAVSKWETDAGYPNLESLKMLSKVFGISLDELVSDEYIESKKILEEKQARKIYFIGLALYVVALALAIAFSVTKIKYLLIPLALLVVAYIVLAYFSKPKYKRQDFEKSQWRIATYIFYDCNSAFDFCLFANNAISLKSTQKEK